MKAKSAARDQTSEVGVRTERGCVVLHQPQQHSAPAHGPRSNEISLKEWLLDEAQREGRSVATIYARIAAGKYPNLKLRRVNKRVVFVQLEVAA